MRVLQGCSGARLRVLPAPLIDFRKDVHRALAVLHTLLKGLERRGAPLVKAQHVLCWHCAVHFGILSARVLAARAVMWQRMQHVCLHLAPRCKAVLGSLGLLLGRCNLRVSMRQLLT